MKTTTCRFLSILLSLCAISVETVCQITTEKDLITEIKDNYKEKQYDIVIDLSKKARDIFAQSPDSNYINILYYEALSYYGKKLYSESFNILSEAINKYEKIGKQDDLLYSLYYTSCYIASKRLPNEFSLSLIHRFLSLDYWGYSDYDLYRQLLFRKYGLLSREEKKDLLIKEKEFTEETNHMYMTSYLYYVMGNMQLWDNFDGTQRPFGIMTDPRVLPDDKNQIQYAINLLELAASGLKGSDSPSINKYYVETLLLLCSAYEGLEEWGKAEDAYDTLWPLLNTYWEKWDCSSPFSYPDIFFREINYGDTKTLDAYVHCLSQTSNHEQIMEICKNAMNNEWFKNNASVFYKNNIINKYNYSAKLLEQPLMPLIMNSGDEVITEVDKNDDNKSKSLIEEYINGELTDERLEDLSSRGLNYGKLDYEFVSYLDSIGDIQTIIKYVKKMVDKVTEEVCLPENIDHLSDYYKEGDLYEIGDYPIIIDNKLDYSKVTLDDSKIGTEREFIHHMNGGQEIVHAYKMLISAYWDNGDYENAISLQKRLHEIVRTDWKWDPNERQELFDMELPDDEIDIWPYEYYFTTELNTTLNLAECLYAIGREEEAYIYWEESLSLCKKILSLLLSTGDFSTKSSRWNQWISTLQRFIESSRFDHVTPKLTSIILDALTFQQGYLTRLNTTIQQFIRDNDTLTNLFEQSRQAEIDLEREYYKKGVLGRDIEIKERYLTKVSRHLYKSIPGDVLLKTNRSPIEELNNILSDKDFFIQFVTTPYSVINLLLLSEDNPYRELTIPNDLISAIVYCKGMDGPQFINLGTLNDLMSVEEDKNILDYLPSFNSMIDKKTISIPYQSITCTEGFWKEILNVVDQYEASRIFFIPTGVINDIAIENMSIEENIPISKRYDIHRITSIDAINGIDDCFSPTSNGIVIGGIQYGHSITTTNERIGDTQERLSPIMDRETMGKLVGTQLEMEDIYAISTTFFSKKTGLEPNEAFFESLSGESPQILHIGTHGINKTYDWITAEEYEYLYGYQKYGRHNYSELSHAERAMYETGLLVAPSEEVNTNGFLSSKEISLYDYHNTDLVSLSACSTGLGVVDGEGVNGLSRALKLAGVNSILASLWNVSDEATRLLMKEFYTNYIKKGLTKNESLERAKEFLRTYSDGGVDAFGVVNISDKEFKYSDPYYWAGFILID